MKLSDVKEVVVVGGGGHIGLPLGIVLANLGHKVTALDLNSQVVELINSGEMPFLEDGAEDALKKALASSRFRATTDQRVISSAEVVIICIGTPVDEHMSPVPRIFNELLDGLKPRLKQGQLLILRSTVYPGTTRLAADNLAGLGIHLAFCPERILQGKAIEELGTLPNIVSGITQEAEQRALSFFQDLGPVVLSSIEEAEFAKLFLNTYRYIEFATTNQLFTIANDAGVDYARILDIMKEEYPRASKIPKPGLTAGPCLMKDTMQLVAYSQNKFTLGYSAFFANEGMALYIVDNVLRQINSSRPVIGLLGMAFKADNDDIRSSLSYRIRKAFQLTGATVLSADFHVSIDRTLVSEAEVIEKSEVVIICAPHKEYLSLDFKGKPVVDIWNILGRGSLIRISNGG
jgi:UDP-N-acetyl-D-mannosaminuronic acid dehydrogenase